MFRVPNRFREKTGALDSDDHYGNNGVFVIPWKKSGELICIASDGLGWEHVSARYHYKIRGEEYDTTPSWEQMCFLKNTFWGPEDLVVQYHPIKSEYVNCHPYVLHLWRKVGTNDFCERPRKHLVG